MNYIIGEDGWPLMETDLWKWATWFETTDRSVGRDIVCPERGDSSTVSTVFLGVDHNPAPGRSPTVWETTVFGGPMSEHSDRCSGNRDDALDMHRDMLSRVRASFKTGAEIAVVSERVFRPRKRRRVITNLSK